MRMSETVKLLSTRAQWENLVRSVSGKAERVTVDRIALGRLLSDHSRALRKLRDFGVATAEDV